MLRAINSTTGYFFPGSSKDEQTKVAENPELVSQDPNINKKKFRDQINDDIEAYKKYRESYYVTAKNGMARLFGYGEDANRTEIIASLTEQMQRDSKSEASYDDQLLLIFLHGYSTIKFVFNDEPMLETIMHKTWIKIRSDDLLIKFSCDHETSIKL